MAFVGWLEKLYLLNTFYCIQVLCYHRQQLLKSMFYVITLSIILLHKIVC